MLKTINIKDPYFWPVIICSCGHVAIDFHLGCYGCKFCCIRTHNPSNKLLDEKSQIEIATPRNIIKILRGSIIDDPTIPIEISHRTDGLFQWFNFYKCFSNRYWGERKYIFLQRAPFPNQEIKTLNKFGSNLILQVTLTPNPTLVGGANFEPEDVLNSLKKYTGNLLISLGPLVSDINTKEVLDLIPKIPSNAKLVIRPLNFYVNVGDNIKKYYTENKKFKQPPLREEDLKILGEKARDYGFDVFRTNHCGQHNFLNTTNPSAYKVEKISCEYCKNKPCLKYKYKDGLEENLSKLGIKFEKIIWENDRLVHVEPLVPTSTFDESYISFKIGAQVKFPNSLYNGANDSILNRWSETSFINVKENMNCLKKHLASV